jgi:hypothetical protein
LLLFFIVLAFTGLDVPQFLLSRPQENRDCLHGARLLTGTAPPWGHPRYYPPRLVPTRLFLFNPGALPLRPFPRMLASLWPGPLRFLFLELCLQPCHPVPNPLTRALETYFLPLQGFDDDDGLASLGPAGLCSLRGASVSFFSHGACLHWHCSLDLAFAVLDTYHPLRFQITSTRPQEDLDCSRLVLPFIGLGHFRGTPR